MNDSLQLDKQLATEHACNKLSKETRGNACVCEHCKGTWDKLITVVNSTYINIISYVSNINDTTTHSKLMASNEYACESDVIDSNKFTV